MYPPTMHLQDIEHELPAGFRFCPSDEELVCHYLRNKVSNQEEDCRDNPIVEVDLHTCEPWQLPDIAKVNSKAWYFFSFRDRKYAKGDRINRATPSGYWKATGRDRAVVEPRSRKIVGMRKSLVFHRNRAPNGIKTGWIMHEFRLENVTLDSKEHWALCRVFHRSRGRNSPHKPCDQHEHFASQNFPAPEPTSIHYHGNGETLEDFDFLLDGSMEVMMPFDLRPRQMPL